MTPPSLASAVSSTMPLPDPGVRAEHGRVVSATGVTRRLSCCRHDELSRSPPPCSVSFTADITSEWTTSRRGSSARRPRLRSLSPPDGASWTGLDVTATLTAPRATVTTSSPRVVRHRAARRRRERAAGRSTRPTPARSSRYAVRRRAVGRAVSPSRATIDSSGGSRGHSRSSIALRLVTPATAQQFLAPRGPWFFALFGRDSIWASRFMLPLGTSLAGDTLRVLTALQGFRQRWAPGEQPGKIVHECVATELGIRATGAPAA